jgi:hypothetical protein
VHAQCCGYTSIEDDRLPASFVCYNCTKPKPQLVELAKLALWRRALGIVWDEEIPSTATTDQITTLATRIGCTYATARYQLSRLVQEKFAHKKPGKGKKHVYCMDKNPSTRLRFEKYFDPLLQTNVLNQARDTCSV